MNVNPIGLSVQVPGGHFNGKSLNSEADVANFSHEEIFGIISQLITQNSFLANQYGVSQSQVLTLAQEIQALRIQVIEIGELKKVTEMLQRENVELREKIAQQDEKIGKVICENDQLSAKIDKVEADLRKLQNTLSARQVGMQVEENVLNYIFPESKKKGFRLRSYKALDAFLNSPEQAVKNDLCDKSAPESLGCLSDEERKKICARLNLVQEKVPDLAYFIGDLKNLYGSVHLSENDIDMLIKHYEWANEETTVEALTACNPLYEKQNIGAYFSSV